MFGALNFRFGNVAAREMTQRPHACDISFEHRARAHRHTDSCRLCDFFPYGTYSCSCTEYLVQLTDNGIAFHLPFDFKCSLEAHRPPPRGWVSCCLFVHTSPFSRALTLVASECQRECNARIVHTQWPLVALKPSCATSQTNRKFTLSATHQRKRNK